MATGPSGSIRAARSHISVVTAVRRIDFSRAVARAIATAPDYQENGRFIGTAELRRATPDERRATAVGVVLVVIAGFVLWVFGFGVEAGEVTPMVAVVRCKGGSHDAKERALYQGIEDCNAAEVVAGLLLALHDEPLDHRLRGDAA